MRRNRLRGITHVPFMAAGDLCFIEVNEPNGTVDVIRGPAPSDFTGSYKGIVRSVDNAGSMPWRVNATFDDRRLVADGASLARLNGKQPPFTYTVTPRFRMQGLTGFGGFELGQKCIVQVVDWEQRPEMLKNPGLSPKEVRSIVPRELIGLWEARIIFATSTGHSVEGGTLYRVAAVLDDPELCAHPNKQVRYWHGRELAVGYNVWRPGVSSAYMHVTREWGHFREMVAEGWGDISRDATEMGRELGKDLKGFWRELTGR